MKFKYIYPALAILWLLSACQAEQQTQESTTNAKSSVFVEKAKAETGIDFNNQLSPSLQLNILEYLYYYNGGGVAVGDINNDGLEDVLLSANQTSDKLFLNKGGLQFEDITASSGIAVMTNWSTGVSMDDVNGDGHLDIYICKAAPVSEAGTHNLLYINKGDGTFTELSQQFGLAFSGYSTQASFFDYDRDGDLDMYLLNHSVHSVSSYGKISKRKEKDDLAGDRLFENRLNESEGTFVDVTADAGIYSSALGYGLGVMTVDINNDGWADIYVGNDFHENDYVYINNRDKTFTESMPSLLGHSSKFTMSVDIADINGDGLQDIFTTDMLPYDEEVALKSGGEDTDQVFAIRKDLGFEDQYARNHLQIQGAANQFSDLALMTNTYATDWSWSVLLQDFDNNEQVDIFITNGIVKRPNDLDYINFVNKRSNNPNQEISQAELDEFLKLMPAQKLPNVLFLQEGALEFSSMDQAKFGTPSFSNGAAYADFDKDGDLDILINNIDADATLLENKSSSKGNYVGFSFASANDTPSAKGAIVEVHYAGKKQKKHYVTTKGFQSSSSHTLFFGIGKEEKVDSVVIIWPDHSKEVLNNVAINTYTELQKSSNTTPYAFQTSSLDVAKISALPIRHEENKFEDYNADKLIPELLSKEGPAVVYADFDQDGQKDLYIGGARYQAPRILLQKNGKFKEQAPSEDFQRDSKYEDVAAAVIDFDNDGDLDLYVISGGNDERELNKALEDRLYLNDGKGNLKRLPISLPHTNGSSIAIGDFDKDGYEDLFIGARSIPGSYGLSPFSFVLKNKKGLGLDLVKKERYGMITDSQWADIDGDDDLDLVMCGDWMPICVLVNQGGGNLEYQSENLGFVNSSGLWNTILLKDLNQDGRLDIIAGNAGKNIKWKASAEKPIQLYIMDADKNGQTEPLIFHHYFSKSMPFMSLDELAAQVPLVRKQFNNYSKFAAVTDISGIELVKEEEIVERKQIDELRSMVYLSEGGGYVGKALPNEAQWSPIQGMTMNEQGQLLFVGNYKEYLTELGQNVANSGGKFDAFDANRGNFKAYQALPLPQQLNTRGILSLGNDRYLISCNNDFQYLLKD